jgi:hypothetical protein
VTTRALIDGFLAERTLAFVGVSRDPRSFSRTALRELRAKGYRLLPVNPALGEVDGLRCYPSLAALDEEVGGALAMVAPAASEQVVREASSSGIRRVWLQQGGSSEAAVRAAEELGVALVHGECILMFAEPAGWFHRLHRGLRRLAGRLPG